MTIWNNPNVSYREATWVDPRVLALPKLMDLGVLRATGTPIERDIVSRCASPYSGDLQHREFNIVDSFNNDLVP